MASTDVILSSPVASDGFRSKWLTSPGAAQVSTADVGGGGRIRQPLKMEVNDGSAAAVQAVVGKQQVKPRFAVEMDGLNCFEYLVSR